MRTSLFFVVLASALLLPGCGIVLDLDSLQHGARDAATDARTDGGSGDGGPVDAGPTDANVQDASLDANADAWVADTGVDSGSDAGGDAGADAGADAGGGVDAAMPTVGVGGTIVGLPAGATLVLSNGSDTQSLPGGSTSFAFTVARGASYDVRVMTAPSTLLCNVYRGQGAATADVTNVFVGCSTAVDLFAYFPFDGDLHAGRGAEFTSTAGPAPSFVTDRVGQASHALGPTAAGTDIRLVHAFNGDGSAVAPNSTQVTVSLWAMVPASLSGATGDGLIGHASPTALSAQLEIQWRSGMPYFELYFYWDGGFSMANITTPVALDRDHWHHVAIAVTGPSGTPESFTRTIFVDGVRQNSVTTCCGWGNATRFWALGQASVPRDDLRIYDRMLTDAEIAGVYAAENVP